MFCFETGKIPTIGRKAFIRPIHKRCYNRHMNTFKLQRNQPASVVAKCYSSVLNNRVQQYLEENEILSDAQNGFRRDRSCEDHIFTLTNLTQNRVYIWFHLVNRDLLQYKLKLIGINGPIYNVISSLYAETFSCVCVNVIRTNRCLSSNSLRHWDNLSPTLFSLFNNDSVSKISQLNVGIPIDHGKIGLLLTTLPFLVKMNLKCKDFRYSYRLVYAMEVQCELWQIKYYAF